MTALRVVEPWICLSILLISLVRKRACLKETDCQGAMGAQTFVLHLPDHVLRWRSECGKTVETVGR